MKMTILESGLILLLRAFKNEEKIQIQGCRLLKLQ